MHGRHRDVGRVSAGGDHRLVARVAVVGQRVVGAPAVGEHDRAGLKRRRTRTAPGSPPRRPERNAAARGRTRAARAPPGDCHDRLVVRVAAADAGLLAADVGLVGLDRAAEALTSGTHHRRAVAVQHRPRRLVGARPEHAPKAQCRDAVLLAGHLPRGGEPHRQRRMGVLEDRARRCVTPAAGTPRTAARHPPSPSRTHSRSAGTRSRPASATNPGSPGTPHRRGTRRAAPRRTLGSADPPAARRHRTGGSQIDTTSEASMSSVSSCRHGRARRASAVKGRLRLAALGPVGPPL